MKDLGMKIENEYKMYMQNFIRSNNVENLFYNRDGYDIAIARAFKDYFDDMLGNEYDVIIKVVAAATKVEMNLFDFVIESYWAFDNSFDFMLYQECKEFLEALN